MTILIPVTTVATFRAACDPTNAARAVRSATTAVQDVAIGSFDILGGIYYGRPADIGVGVKYLGWAAVATVDTAIYSLATLVPIIPIGYSWSLIRRQL